jgi:hypothetical protein
LDAALEAETPAFRWQDVDGEGTRYTVQVAREALFRPQDMVETSPLVEETSYTMQAAPTAGWRYFWRVRAIGPDGRGGEWCRPQPFVYRWPEYSETYPPRERAARRVPDFPGRSRPAPDAAWQRAADEQRMETTENLAWLGEIYGTGGHMQAPSRAADAQAFSWWSNGEDVARSRFTLPAQWCVIWPEKTAVRRVTILWNEGRLPVRYALEVSDDGLKWTELHRAAPGQGALDRIEPAEQVEARYLRVRIPEAAAETGEVGIREILIE